MSLMHPGLFDMFDDTSAHTPAVTDEYWYTIYFIETTQFNAATSTKGGSTVKASTNYAAGSWIFGHFDKIHLISGSIHAYRNIN